MNYIEEAKRLAGYNGRVAVGDIELLVNIIESLPKKPIIVEDGAGSHGAFAATIFGVNENAKLYSIDADVSWEALVLANLGYRGKGYMPYASPEKANEKAKLEIVDLVIIDPNNVVYVAAQLKYWSKKVKPGGYIFVHDYKNEKIAEICKKYFKRKASYYRGWSAVWKMKGE